MGEVLQNTHDPPAILCACNTSANPLFISLYKKVSSPQGIPPLFLEEQVINADLNGSYNILRKAFPEAITVDGIAGLGLVPYSVKLTELNQLDNLNTSVTTKSQKLFLADGIGGAVGTPVRSRSDTILIIQKKDKS